ncbi:MAG: hypothetical protein QM635_10035 [Microbacteriaceae bacterium]
MRWSRASAERGSAAIELLAGAVVLLVPLVYLVLAIAAVQGAALAVEGAARQAARVFVQQSDEAAARAAAERAVTTALADFGIDRDRATVTIDCGGSGCLAARTLVTVEVRASVPLPLVPSLLDLRLGTAVPISASSTQPVSRFAGVGR